MSVPDVPELAVLTPIEVIRTQPIAFGLECSPISIVLTSILDLVPAFPHLAHVASSFPAPQSDEPSCSPLPCLARTEHYTSYRSTQTGSPSAALGVLLVHIYTHP